MSRVLAWERVGSPGLERLLVSEERTGPIFEGTVLLVEDDTPLEIRYRLDCTSSWETRAVVADVREGPEVRRVELSRDEKGTWLVDGVERPELAGCVDVDLAWTPATNTLPIRRLRLPVGAESELVAAWVRPDLSVRPLPQRYVRSGPSRYRYESRGGSFAVDLEVDGEGYVLDYPGAWRRVGRSAAPGPPATRSAGPS